MGGGGGGGDDKGGFKNKPEDASEDELERERDDEGEVNGRPGLCTRRRCVTWNRRGSIITSKAAKRMFRKVRTMSNGIRGRVILASITRLDPPWCVVLLRKADMTVMVCRTGRQAL